ncbi:unnamed protein product [Ectocarpus fasciculatus]
MQAVAGDLVDFFESLDACVDVVLRYPGIVRFRPHLIHCILASSHFVHRRDVYDAISGVYNSTRPTSFPQAPPYEEWRSMSQLCGNTFCRSMEAEALQRRNNGGLLRPSITAVDGLEMPGPSSALTKSPCSGTETRSSGSPPAGLPSKPQRSPSPATGAMVATNVPSPLPETSHAPPGLSQDGVGNDDAAPARDMRWQAGLAATAATSIPESRLSPEAADPRGVRADWSSAAASGQQLRLGGDTVAADAADADANHTPTIEPVEGGVVLWGREMTLTDADLPDAAAVFARDEALLEQGLYE